MGFFSNLFGGSDTPTMNIPEAPKLPTADELFASGTNYAKTNSPMAFGAREGALTDLGRGMDYYQQFQPTSIEQALASQYFSNVMPDLETSIKHNLSLSGIASSPILAQQIAKARGNVGYDIGSFLSNQGNQRAQYSLDSRMGIDPMSMVTPFVNTGMQQSQAQANYQSQYDMARAINDYQNALAEQQRKSQMIGSIGSLIGGAGGFMLGGPAGASLGAGIGGNASSVFGGSSPVSMGDSMDMYDFFNNKGMNQGIGRNISSVFGGRSPMGY